MSKRKLRSDSAREKEEGTRLFRPRPAKKPPSGLQNQRRRKVSAKKKNLIADSQPSPTNISGEVSKISNIITPNISPSTSSAQEYTISSILAVISKSISGLRLRQNTITLNQIALANQPYASAIFRSRLLADKLLAFRTSGPSFSAIRNTLLPPGISPPEINALLLVRWINMRLFAFGHPDLIAALGTVETPQDVLDAREAYKVSSGLGVNSLAAYGNVRFDPKRVPEYIDRIFTNGPGLFAAMVREKEREDGVALFSKLMELIEEAKIPYHSPGTLFQWLLACDFAELEGFVAPPTARDLAYRVEHCAKGKKGGSGVWNGLIRGIEETNWPELTADSLTDHLEGIYRGVKAGLGTQEVLFGERGFWYSDLEHCLCKVIRATKY